MPLPTGGFGCVCAGRPLWQENGVALCRMRRRFKLLTISECGLGLERNAPPPPPLRGPLQDAEVQGLRRVVGPLGGGATAENRAGKRGCGCRVGGWVGMPQRCTATRAHAHHPPSHPRGIAASPLRPKAAIARLFVDVQKAKQAAAACYVAVALGRAASAVCTHITLFTARQPWGSSVPRAAPRRLQVTMSTGGGGGGAAGKAAGAAGPGGAQQHGGATNMNTRAAQFQGLLGLTG